MQKVKEKSNWKGETIVEIEIERLKAFRNHPFQVRDDDDLEKLKESIKMYGILTPLLVRPIKDGTYEIISGHRRKRAAALLGYRKIPVQGIYELIVETVAYTGKKLVIASNELPTEFVKNRFMKLNFMHIQYVISSMKKNTTEIKNIKKYLLAALYNAPATMQGYYQAEVNHAMPQYAERSR